MRTAEERLRWFLLDMQPDAIGDYEIWEHVDCDKIDGDDADEEYLRQCYLAIDAAMDAAPQPPEAAG